MKPTAIAFWILIVCASLAVACQGNGGPFAEEQRAYDQWLEVAREGIADDPGAQCDPAFWTRVASTHGGPGLIELIELAYSDACKEAGHLSDSAPFSIYYPGPPETR